MVCEPCERARREYEEKRKKAIEYGIKNELQEVVLLKVKNGTIAICHPDDERVQRFTIMDRVWIG